LGRGQGCFLSVLGLASLFSRSLYKDGASFDVTQSTVDPSAIMSDIITEFQSAYSGTPEWIGTDAQAGIRTGGQNDSVGTNVTYTFRKLFWNQACEKTLELAGGDRFFFIDKGGDFIFKDKPTTATHAFTIGKDVEELRLSHTQESVINDVTVEYTTGTVTQDDATSESDFGLNERYFVETDTTDATSAQQIADAKIADFKDKRIKGVLTINDNYDIETIEPGHTVKVQNLLKGSTSVIDNMLVVATAYTENKIKLELAEQSANIGESISDLIASS